MEEWKTIKGYEGLYKVSNEGRIKTEYGLIFKPSIHSGGYNYVCLTKDKVEKNITLHREVAKAFIPNPFNKKYVNHIDGNKLNNHVNNLEWCTASENMKHAYANKLQESLIGIDHPLSKLTEEQVREIKVKLKNKQSMASIAREFNMSPGGVQGIKENKIWKHIII